MPLSILSVPYNTICQLHPSPSFLSQSRAYRHNIIIMRHPSKPRLKKNFQNKGLGVRTAALFCPSELSHISSLTMAAVRRLLLLALLTLSLCNLSFSQLPEGEALLKLKSSLIHAGGLDNWASGSSPCVKRWVGVICFGGAVEGLHLSDLGLSGTIDIEALQQLRGLRTMSFVNNSFSGPIPEFNKLGALKSLLLTHNEFSGEISNDFFASMSSLKKVWLANNKFTGKIPESLMNLPYLRELHLEGNLFSGSIPPLKQPKQVLESLDFSVNMLEGQIPESFSGFSASSFSRNDGLCGKPLDKDCATMVNNTTSGAAGEEENGNSSGGNTKYVVGVAVLAILTAAILFSCRSSGRRHRDDDFSVLGRESLNQRSALMMRASGSSKRPLGSSRKSNESTRRGGSFHTRNSTMGDLVMLTDEKGSFGLSDLMKAAAEVLGNGGLGSAYKATMGNGLSVVVKRVREMNMFGRDMFDAEMRRFGRIRHRNILTPLAYHFRKEEKLLVSEHIPRGSLLYILHGDRGICHAGLNWETRLNIVQGIANGLAFLHSEYSSYNLPHGNLKSSNVLLGENYEPFLSDYALDPLINPTHAAQAMFAYKSPEYLQYHQVSPKSDIYCLGIIILEVITGKFPSQYLSNGKGGTDVVQWVLQAISEKREQEVIDPEIASNANSIQDMLRLLQIGAACCEINPTQRLSIREAIRRIEEIHI